MNAEAGRTAMTTAISSSASEGRLPSRIRINTGGHTVLNVADSSLSAGNLGRNLSFRVVGVVNIWYIIFYII